MLNNNILSNYIEVNYDSIKTLLKKEWYKMKQSKFDEDIFQSAIQQIIIPAPNRIKFIFSDNTRKTVEWKDRSRSESWTEDMRKTAGERSKKWHEQSP